MDRIDEAGDRRESPGDDEGEADDPDRVDTAKPRHAAVVGDRLPGPAERRSPHRGKDGKDRDKAEHRDDALHRRGDHGERTAQELDGIVENRLQPALMRPLGQSHDFLKRDGKADGGDEQRLIGPAGEWQEHCAGNDPAGTGRQQRGDGERKKQREGERDRNAGGPGQQRQADAGDRAIGAEHRHRSEGKVDAAGDAVDERIGQRQRGIDRRGRCRVHPLLQEIAKSGRHVRPKLDGGKGRRDQPRAAFRHRAEFAEPEAVQQQQFHLAPRTVRSGKARHPQPVEREIRPAETADEEGLAVVAAGIGNGVVDANARAAGRGKRPRGDEADERRTDLHRRHDAFAHPRLVAVDAGAGSGKQRQGDDGKDARKRPAGQSPTAPGRSRTQGREVTRHPPSAAVRPRWRNRSGCRRRRPA